VERPPRPGGPLGGVSRVLRAAAVVVGVVCALALVADVLYEIGGRLWIKGGAAPWTVDAADFLLIWITFLGASVAVCDRSEPAIRVLVDRTRPAVRRAIDDLTDTACLVISTYLVVFGVSLCRTQLHEHASASGFPLIWVAAAIPVGGVLMAMHRIAHMAAVRSWRQLGAVVIVGGLCLLAFDGALTLAEGDFYVLLFGLLAVTLALGTPVAEALLFSAAVAYNVAGGFGASNIALTQHIYDGLNNFTFVAVPLFLMTGALMARTRVADRLTAVLKSWVGWMPGGLGVADIGASAIFADISGSAVADTVALGSVMIPQMERDGFDRDFASGLQSAAGTQGILYPPSISILLYAAAANASVAYMFASLLVPAILVTLSFILVCVLVSARRGYGTRVRFTAHRALRSGLLGLPALFTIVIILGGLFSGLFTASEAGAVAVVYTAVVGLIDCSPSPENRLAARSGSLRRRAGRSVVWRVSNVGLAFSDGLMSVGRIMFIIAGALAFGFLIILNGAPQAIVTALGHFADHQLALVVLLMLALVLIHTFLDVSSTILVVIPLVLPVLALGHVNLGYFGVLVMLNSAIGQILPPLGLNMFLVASLTGAPVLRVAKASLPFVGVLLVDLVLVLFFPVFSQGLPSLLGLSL
jgi:C4-dicarboxylate transporter DctM subunit